MLIVDAHQHFWKLSRGDYSWLLPSAGALYRDYLPDDLIPLLRANNVNSTVLIQAAPTEAETRYLLELAKTHDFIGGVVGWVDFGAVDAAGRIDALVAAGEGRLKGLRPMVQDMVDPRWLTRPSLDTAFEAMVQHQLVFDALVRPVHLGVLQERLQRHHGLRTVIDHAGKPDIANGCLTPWQTDLQRLAQESNVYCKLSGILSEAGERRTQRDLIDVMRPVFEDFGADRILWGSDWPVLNSAGNYESWLSLAKAMVNMLAPDSMSGVFGGNAQRVYRLHSSSV